jgi:hypothetical protein
MYLSTKKWPDKRYVLKWFGRKEGDAKISYKEFVKKGIALGHIDIRCRADIKTE